MRSQSCDGGVDGLLDAEGDLAIFHMVFLPIAIEFQPDLVIVSAGYDAAIGCPEGEMMVTPAAYPHLLHQVLIIMIARL